MLEIKVNFAEIRNKILLFKEALCYFYITYNAFTEQMFEQAIQYQCISNICYLCKQSKLWIEVTKKNLNTNELQKNYHKFIKT